MSEPTADWFPERGDDDSDAGWGEGPAEVGEGRGSLEDYLRERPPHSAD